MLKKTKVLIGIGLILIGVTGFLVSTQFKSQNSIATTKFTKAGAHLQAVPVKKGDEYTVFFFGRDEETGLATQWADLEFDALIRDDVSQNILFTKKVTATASSADETGGIKRAQNSGQYIGTATSDGTWSIYATLIRGDEVTVDVYQNLPELLNIAPGLFILLALVGIFLVLKGRAKS